MQEPEQIEQVFMRYFKDIFTTTMLTNLETIYDAVDQRISRENNGMLQEEFNEKEVKEALHQMNPNKALRPDGMSSCLPKVLVN